MKYNRIFPVGAPAPLLEFLLEQMAGQSRNNVKHMLSRGQVLVDDQVQRQFDLPLHPGQQVTLLPPARGPALPFPILYEDDSYLVVDKPAGLLSTATDSERQRTAFRILMDHLRTRRSGEHLFLVHRLDRDTSGALLFTKDASLRQALQQDWNRLVQQRGYLAVVEGEDIPHSGICRSKLTQNSVHRVYSTKGDGKEAVTRYRLLAQKPGYALLDVEIQTGRKNQIRAHLSELGHPVAGDEKYGAHSDPMGRLALHACQLSFGRF